MGWFPSYNLKKVILSILDGVTKPLAEHVNTCILADSIHQHSVQNCFLSRILLPYLELTDLAMKIRAVVSLRLDSYKIFSMGLPSKIPQTLWLVQNRMAYLLIKMCYYHYIRPILKYLYHPPISFVAQFKVLVIKVFHDLGSKYLQDHLSVWTICSHYDCLSLTISRTKKSENRRLIPRIFSFWILFPVHMVFSFPFFGKLWNGIYKRLLLIWIANFGSVIFVAVFNFFEVEIQQVVVELYEVFCDLHCFCVVCTTCTSEKRHSRTLSTR